MAVTAQIPVAVRETFSVGDWTLKPLFEPITKRTAVVGTSRIRVHWSVTACPWRPRRGLAPFYLWCQVTRQNREHSCPPAGIWQKPNAGLEKKSNSLVEIRDKIARSQHPLILIGLGTPPSAAGEIRSLGITAPFLVTPKVKGILPEDHALFVGVASGMAIDRDIVSTLRAADLIMSIGFDPVEADGTWFAELDMVSIDSASMTEGAYHPVEAIGDLQSLVSGLVTLIAEPKPWPRVPRDSTPGFEKNTSQHRPGYFATRISRRITISVTEKRHRHV